jgi:hypothetical protein
MLPTCQCAQDIPGVCIHTDIRHAEGAAVFVSSEKAISLLWLSSFVTMSQLWLAKHADAILERIYTGVSQG